MGFRTTCPSFSTIFFLIIFVVSVIFHCHQRLALVPAPWASRGLVVPVPRHLPQGGMFTINAIGRLGNQMGEYATLYALAKLNGRPAVIPAEMHSTLAPIFRISLPGALADYPLHDWMEEQYRHIPWEYVRLTGYPCSWTFYHHLRPEILREFTLHDHVRAGAQRFLQTLQAARAPQLTFVGVHVRRGDYVRVMPRVWKGVLADRGYLRRPWTGSGPATPAPVFVVTSDDMAWCRENIDSSLGDVVFAGTGRQGSPAKDFALLTQCNHTVFTVGTFGVWAAYLAGGDAVYLANFTLPQSRFRTVFKPQAAFLPEWVGIAANPGAGRRKQPLAPHVSLPHLGGQAVCGVQHRGSGLDPQV
ncbi:hypothetical protein QTO34_010164 [Cnephaeus nilssonii]|uniref:L-Fucosyltransferase n=1 Tax=Cnephaeus nilssonii TaxID=3371016 RepID=A0AA40HEU8_CNENI|nr:hypothetical protein QTO34_010164 [Eptesicus nilssonii]